MGATFTSGDVQKITKVLPRELKHWIEKDFIKIAADDKYTGTGRSRRYTRGNLFEVLLVKTLKSAYIPDGQAAAIKNILASFLDELKRLPAWKDLGNPFEGNFDLGPGWQVRMYNGDIVVIVRVTDMGVIHAPIVAQVSQDGQTTLVPWNKRLEYEFTTLTVVNLSRTADELTKRLTEHQQEI